MGWELLLLLLLGRQALGRSLCVLLVVLGWQGVDRGLEELLRLGLLRLVLLAAGLLLACSCCQRSNGGGDRRRGQLDVLEHVEPLLHAEDDDGELGVVDEELDGLFSVLGHAVVKLPHDLVKLIRSHGVDCARDRVKARGGAARARHVLPLGCLDGPRGERGEGRAAGGCVRSQLDPQQPPVHLKVVEHAYRVRRTRLVAELAVSESLVLPHVVADKPRHAGAGGVFSRGRGE